MIKYAVAIRDSRAEVFSDPLFFPARGAAVRAFADVVNDEKSEYAKHPEDYTLFYLGQYDDVAGTLIPNPMGPEVLLLGVNARSGTALKLEGN